MRQLLMTAFTYSTSLSMSMERGRRRISGVGHLDSVIAPGIVREIFTLVLL